MKMKGQKYSIAFYLLILLTFCSCVYSDYNDHISPGNTTYYINPTDGDDENSGLKSERAWPTFSQINNIKLSAGDRVEITSPGSFDQSLLLSGDGTRPFHNTRYTLVHQLIDQTYLNLDKNNIGTSQHIQY